MITSTRDTRCSNCKHVTIETAKSTSRQCVEWIRYTCTIHKQHTKHDNICMQFEPNKTRP